MTKLKPYQLILFFYAFLLYEELVLRICTADTFFGPGLLSILAFSAPFSILMGLLASAFSPKINHKVAIGLTAFCTVLFCSQQVYNYIFNNFYILFSYLHGKKSFAYWREGAQGALERLPILILQVLPGILILFFGKKLLSFERVDRRGALHRLAAFAMTVAAAIGLLLPFGTGQFSPYDLMKNTSDIVFSVRDLGLMMAMRGDLVRTVTGRSVDADPLPPLIDPEPPEVTYIEPDTEVPLESAPETTGPTPATHHMLDIDFAALLERESNEDLAEMHQYFSVTPPTEKNEKTGLFAGSNVIFIVAEGFSHYVIDEELTPTLYKMQTEGYQFTDFYTPLWGVSTSDGEYVAAQGLIPKAGSWSFYQSYSNYLPFVLGRQLSGLGYAAFAYHNHDYSFYERQLSHPNMGYLYKADGAGLPVTRTWPASDEEMIALSVDDFSGQEPFHVYYMTVSGHLHYSFEGNDMAAKHRDAVSHLPYSEEVQAYLACNQELENAMALLLDKLEAAGTLDNTLFVLSADHYPYGLSDAALNELAGHELDRDFDIYRNTLMIWQPGMEPEVIDQPCGSMDILPTVSNLLGLEYDSRLLMGRDIFSDSEPLVIFSNRSFITKDATYATRTRQLTAKEGVILPEGYLDYWTDMVNRKFKYSAGILDNDYYRLLFPEAAEATVSIPCIPDEEEGS